MDTLDDRMDGNHFVSKVVPVPLVGQRSQMKQSLRGEVGRARAASMLSGQDALLYRGAPTLAEGEYHYRVDWQWGGGAVPGQHWRHRTRQAWPGDEDGCT